MALRETQHYTLFSASISTIQVLEELQYLTSFLVESAKKGISSCWEISSHSRCLFMTLSPPALLINNSFIILKPLSESLSSRDSLFPATRDEKKKENIFTDIPPDFLLLEDTTDTRCRNHNVRVLICAEEGCWILNAQQQMVLQKIVFKHRATKHLSAPVTFIYDSKHASAGF